MYRNCFEITLELGCCKYPPAMYIKPYWYANREALLKYIDLVHTTGIRGFIFDRERRPLEGAKIVIDCRAKKIKTSKDGDFWRLLVPGNYTIRVSKRKYRNINMRVTVNPDQATVLNITLTRKRSFSNFGKGRWSDNLTQALDDGPAANLSFHPIVRSHDKLRLSMKNSKGTASRLKNLFCDSRFIPCLIIFCLSRLGWDHNCKRLHYLVNTVLKIYIWN